MFPVIYIPLPVRYTLYIYIYMAYLTGRGVYISQETLAHQLRKDAFGVRPLDHEDLSDSIGAVHVDAEEINRGRDFPAAQIIADAQGFVGVYDDRWSGGRAVWLTRRGVKELVQALRHDTELVHHAGAVYALLVAEEKPSDDSADHLLISSTCQQMVPTTNTWL